MTPTRTLNSGTVLGRFVMGPGAPNGSCPGRVERTRTEFELYAADFYGRGERVYLRRRYRLQAEGQPPGPVFEANADGHPDRIGAFCERHGIEFPAI